MTDRELGDGYEAATIALRAQGDLEAANRFAEAARALQLGYARSFPKFRGFDEPSQAHLSERQLRALRAYAYGNGPRWPVRRKNDRPVEILLTSAPW